MALQHGNNQFDIGGMFTAAELAATFGGGTIWGPTVVASTFIIQEDGLILEADIALNASRTFTGNDLLVFTGSSAISFRQVMLHEVGHLLGADHWSTSLSQMAPNSTITGFTMPYADDAQGVRARYGGIPRHDLGVYLYRWQNDDFNDMAWATVPSSVIAGNSINVSGYTIENVGTQTIQPRVEWYFTRGFVLDITSIPLAERHLFASAAAVHELQPGHRDHLAPDPGGHAGGFVPTSRPSFATTAVSPRRIFRTRTTSRSAATRSS